MGSVTALSLGATFVIWGVLFGLAQIGANGVLLPEVSAVLPIMRPLHSKPNQNTQISPYTQCFDTYF